MYYSLKMPLKRLSKGTQPQGVDSDVVVVVTVVVVVVPLFECEPLLMLPKTIYAFDPVPQMPRLC